MKARFTPAFKADVEEIIVSSCDAQSLTILAILHTPRNIRRELRTRLGKART